MVEKGPAILAVDDDPVALELIRTTLSAHGMHNVELLSDSRSAMSFLRSRRVSLLLLDLFMPHVSGADILARVEEEFPRVPVIVLTVDDSVDAAVECMRMGAFDFMTKPFDRNRLVTSVRAALRVHDLETRVSLFAAREAREAPRTEPARPELFASIVTESDSMMRLFAYVEAVGPSPNAVLITGESGSGKELVARAVHETSGRSGEFVPVNVSGLDDSMFTDTLFGHRQGAFTGADRPRSGLVERAAGGTLFLDEVGELETASQIKLLRLLQEQEYYPLGSDEPHRAEVRIVAATNADLVARQQSGAFRRDLYYRLVSHHAHVPALRERPEDVGPLIRHFVRESCAVLGRETLTVNGRVLELLDHYPFPGNVRELQAIVADAVSRSTGRELSPEVVQEYLARQGALTPAAVRFPDPLPTLAEVEDALITEALRRTSGNQSAAARLLGVAQSTLSRRTRAGQIQR